MALSLLLHRTVVSRMDLVRSILRIGQSLHMVTIAEGIETEEQSALITGMGCELGQGYLFARPLPVADVDAWLSKGSPAAATAHAV